jgi:hypothetical protein
MKRLIWKLVTDNKTRKYRKYSIEYRWWFVISYWIITSPIILVLWVFKKLYDLYWKPFHVYETRIESSEHDKKTRKSIFKKLLET